MNVRELRWWSPSALVAVVTAVEPTWSRWCESWGVAPAPVVAMNACETPPQAVVSAMEPLADVRAWLGVDRLSRSEAMRDLLFGEMASSPDHEGSMARDVAKLAWADLGVRLVAPLGDANRPMTVDRPAPPRSDFARWSGAVVLHLACSGATTARFVLHVSEPCASRLADDGRRPARFSSSSHVQTWSVSDAMQDHRVPLRVGLDDVLLDVATLGSLRCGDVLALPHRLDQTLRVRVVTADHDADDDDFCAAVLGARGERRAVELVRLP